MDITFQIRKFFELPNVLDDTIQEMSKRTLSPKTDHVVNSISYKNKLSSNFQNKIVIQIFLYLDGFEINNPLGSHAIVDNICGVYYTFPTIPQQLLSKSDFIFVAAYFKTTLGKKFGIDLFLQPLVNCLKSLESESIVINTDLGPKRVFFVLCNILADNLGLNEVLGFNTSFNSNSYCRFCTKTKQDLMKDATPDQECFRNVQNYEQALLQDDPKLTGVKRSCVFNQLTYFHATENYIVDIMHDFFEGICKYDISEILLNFITVNKFFTLENFNFRKEMFNYGEIEIGNITQPFQVSHLKLKSIRASAREMMNITHFLTLIIGDLVSPNNQIWKFFYVSTQTSLSFLKLSG